MKRISGVWLPDHEEHLIPFLEQGNGTYQYRTLDRALHFCRRFRRAIDIGAHVGLWSMHLITKFQKVVAFEPVPEHRECFLRNVPKANVTLFPCVLGEEEKEVQLDWDKQNTGHTHIGKGSVSTPMRRLDSYEFENADFIKVDTEGYEYFVLKGGERLLLQHKPVLCIEQKPHGYYGLEVTAAVKYVQSLGGVVLDRVNDDYIMGWKSSPARRVTRFLRRHLLPVQHRTLG